MAGNGTITPDGYRLIRRPDHPLANRWGTVPEHRQVLYDAIGDGEHPCRWCGKVLTWRDKRISYKINADHVDGDRLNNALSNLVPACMECNTRRGLNEAGLKEFAAELAAMDGPTPADVLLAIAAFVKSGRFYRGLPCCGSCAARCRGMASTRRFGLSPTPSRRAARRMDDIHSRIKGAEYSIRRTLTTIRSRLDSVEHALDNGRVLNPMGELQSLGPQFDAAVAVLATLREVRSALGIQEGGTSDE